MVSGEAWRRFVSTDGFASPAPQRGSAKIAQGKAAEAAALGKTPTPLSSPFSKPGFAPKGQGAKTELEKGVVFGFGVLPRAAAGARPEWMGPFARTIGAAKKYVVSSTLDQVDWNAELASRLEFGSGAVALWCEPRW